jgi:hypothetical protein
VKRNPDSESQARRKTLTMSEFAIANRFDFQRDVEKYWKVT